MHPSFEGAESLRPKTRMTIEDAIRTAMAEARERAAWDLADAARELETV